MRLERGWAGVPVTLYCGNARRGAGQYLRIASKFFRTQGDVWYYHTVQGASVKGRTVGVKRASSLYRLSRMADLYILLSRR